MANIIEIIKDENADRKLIWKSPYEDFNTGSQLIVHESQEAVFFMNGQALDLFGPGKYTLETQNMPLLSRFFNRTSGGQTPFHCEVYFVDKTEQMGIKWGTDSQVQYMEPKYNFPLQIGACGEMTYQIEDSRKLLVKIVGTEKDIDNTKLMLKLKSFIMARVKPYLAEAMQKGEYSIFEVDSHMNELSEYITAKLVNDFDEYGICLKHFFVTTIAKPEGDEVYEKFKDLHIRQYSDITEANLRKQVGIIESEETAKKREIEGYTYQQEKTYDVAEKLAQNEGVGDYSNLGVGLGMMGGVAGTVSSTVNSTLNEIKPQNNNHDNNNGDLQDFKNKVEKLKTMKEAGLLTDEEFEQEKRRILESI